MATHGVPNDVLSNLDPLALIIFIPICDLFVSLLNPISVPLFSLIVSSQLYPGLRRLGINFSPLKKITLGFFTGAAAMVWAVSASLPPHYLPRNEPDGSTNIGRLATLHLHN